MLTGPAAFALLFTGVLPRRGCVDGRDRKSDGRAVLDVAVGVAARRRRFAGDVRSASLLAFGGIAIIGFDPRVFAYREGLVLVVLSCFVGSLGLIFVKRLKT